MNTKNVVVVLGEKALLLVNAYYLLAVCCLSDSCRRVQYSINPTRMHKVNVAVTNSLSHRLSFKMTSQKVRLQYVPILNLQIR